MCKHGFNVIGMTLFCVKVSNIDIERMRTLCTRVLRYDIILL